MTLPDSRARGKFWCWHRWKKVARYFPKRLGWCFGFVGYWPAEWVEVGKRCTKCGKVRR